MITRCCVNNGQCKSVQQITLKIKNIEIVTPQLAEKNPSPYKNIVRSLWTARKSLIMTFDIILLAIIIEYQIYILVLISNKCSEELNHQ